MPKVSSGRSASAQAVTQVNTMQAPKRVMQRLTRCENGESWQDWENQAELPVPLPGYG